MLGGPGAKFGVPRARIVDAYRAALAAGATRFGMHMMTGSCVMSDDYWVRAMVGAQCCQTHTHAHAYTCSQTVQEATVTVLLEAVTEVHARLGIKFEFINIGGGLGIPYRPEQEGVNLPRLAMRLRRVVDAQRQRLCLPFEPVLCMENGRFITGPSGWLVSRCRAVKEGVDGTRYVCRRVDKHTRAFSTHSTPLPQPACRTFGLDACMAHLMRPGMYGAYHHITVPAHGNDGTGPHRPANVVGTLCENNDWFAKVRARMVGSGGGEFGW